MWFSNFFEDTLVNRVKSPHLHPHRKVLPLGIHRR
jgi:hypothetical protein